MSHHASRHIAEQLNNWRKGEENALQSNAFVGTIAKGYKYSLLAASVVGIGLGYFLCVPIQDPSVGMIFASLGIVILLMLPTYFSYRCYVDKSTLKAEYYILCFKIKKEVSWKDVKYKVVKRDPMGSPLSLRLYDKAKKKLIFFDCSIVGFSKIIRLAKKTAKLKG